MDSLLAPTQVNVNGEVVGQIEVVAPLEAHSMKGYELYTWQSGGRWWFSLLTGTNRAKTIEEVTDPNLALKGVEDLETQLSYLAEGEFVTWLPLPSGENPEIPPRELLEEIRAFCESRGLVCVLPTP